MWRSKRRPHEDVLARQPDLGYGSIVVLLFVSVWYLSTKKKRHDEVKELFTKNRQPLGTMRRPARRGKTTLM